jgi:Zn finger protein HypA/HybF involved in hydrogenase expression
VFIFAKKIQGNIVHHTTALAKRRKEMAEKGYCVKCKTQREMKEEQKVTMKNKRLAVKGKCPECGTGMYKILGKQ